LERNPDDPDPDGHGWTKDEGSPKLGIDWMHRQPASDSVLELLACKCKKECKAGECICLDTGLKCTYMCLLQTCGNQKEDADESYDYDSDMSDMDWDDDG